MPITLEQIVEETRHWPPEKVELLVEHLTGDLHPSEPKAEEAWKREIDRRLADIQSGKVQGVPAEEVFARARQILGQ